MLQGWLSWWSHSIAAFYAQPSTFELAKMLKRVLTSCARDVALLISFTKKIKEKLFTLVNLQSFLHPPLLAKVRVAGIYTAWGITLLNQWVVSVFIESSCLAFLCPASFVEFLSGQNAVGLGRSA